VKQFLITVAGVLVGLILFVIIVPMVLIGALTSAASKHDGASLGAQVLSLDLRVNRSDTPPTSPFAFDGNSIVEIVRKLNAAQKDGKIKGVYIRANTAGVAGAHAEELRSALQDLRKSGKYVIASIQNDGVRMSLAGYATIAGADEIWLHGAGEFAPMGMVAERTFFGDTLRRFKVAAQFEAREEYKTGPNEFTETGFTGPDRVATNALLNGVFDHLITLVAEDRKAKGFSVESTRKAIEGTPYTAEQALALKLVDKIGTPEEAQQAALERAGGTDKAELVEIEQYTPKPRSGPTIAILSGEGVIVTGAPEGASFNNDAVMNGDEISQALLDAAQEKDVKAIVFRVSSPGGSAVASDQIWRAVETAQAKGKKVVVSMGAVAASGGYYVSAGADEIVAWPTTITGSIGVYGGKFVLGDAARHYLSARTDSIQTGSPVANAFTASRPFTNAERAMFATFIDRTYQDFMGVVAKGRGLTPEQVREVARGRVWTGAAAKDVKLVNTMGGINVAIDRAKALAGISANSSVTLKLYPERKNPIQALQEMFGASADNARATAALRALLADPRTEAAVRRAMTDRGAARAETSIDIY
jgi:protease-4